MELWIRSQDKEVLTRVVDIWKDADKNEIWSKSSFATKNCLGIYKTKERAIEILDEIQMLLQPIIKYEPIVQEEYNPAHTYRHFIKVDYNTEIKELSTFVYQMPEK